MSLLFRRMPYITRSRHGVWKYRRAIPGPLRTRAGKREIIVSLGTKDEREAELKSLRVHEDAESLLRAWMVLEKGQGVQRSRGDSGDPSAASAPTVASVVAQDRSAVDDWYRGLEFLKVHGLAYRPYREGMADEEFQTREAIVTTKLGIDPHNDDTRDRELETSPEAQAVLDILKKPNPTLDEALKV